MKLKKSRRIFVAVLVALAVCGGIFYLNDRRKIGDELDVYRGVPVYHNGIFYAQSSGKHYSAEGYYYGYKWQCVEHVKRFYYDAMGHEMPDVYGNAKDFFDPDTAHGEINTARNMRQYRNGGDEPPKPDDLLVFNDTKYGHVAIITEVTDTDIEVIQQNVYGKPRERFPLVVTDGTYTIGEDKKPAGWLRVVNSESADFSGGAQG